MDEPRPRRLHPELLVFVVCALFMVGFAFQLLGRAYDFALLERWGDLLTRPFIVFGGALVIVFMVSITIRVIAEKLLPRSAAANPPKAADNVSPPTERR